MRRIMMRLDHMDQTMHGKLDHVLSQCVASPGVPAVAGAGHSSYTGTHPPERAPDSSENSPMTPGMSSDTSSSLLLTRTNLLSPAPTIPDQHRVVIQLGTEKLTVDRRAVPDPPVQHFSSQISNLFREWEIGTLLRLNGQPIPLKYWGAVYQDYVGIKRGAWGAIKVEFTNWKVRTIA